MDKLSSMRVFTAVARAGTFTAAADELGMSKAMVTKHIKHLENDLGVRLLNRTTRRMSLTEVGSEYLERCKHILAEVEETELAVSQLSSEPRGTLRVAAPSSFGAFHLATAAAEFMFRFPDIEIRLILTDRWMDLIEEGLDMAIRVGKLGDSSLIARKLATTRIVVCGSPEYLEKSGTPAHPNELQDHHCLIFTPHPPVHEWEFSGPDGEFEIPVTGRIHANAGDALRMAAIRGLGLIQQPTYMVGQDIKRGRLKMILNEFEAKHRDISAVYPHRRHLSAKVRSFVDFLHDRFQPIPYWEDW